MSTSTQLLTIAEAYDNYCASCRQSSSNSTARSSCNYKPYFLSQTDATRLTTIIRTIDLLRDTDTVILHSSADNGYPHTRPKAIVCLPAGFVESASDAILKETMCHEAMHIHQRRNLDLWKQMCMVEGWTPLPKDTIPFRFRERCRLNPDTFKPIPFWAWDKHYVPLPMFKRDINITLGDVNIEWFDLRTGALFHTPPASFTKKYGTPSQPEHPFEIYAVIFAKEGISSEALLEGRMFQLISVA